MAMYSLPILVWHQIKRIGPLGLIILLHIGFFYAIQSGLVRQAAETFPKEIFATFITSEAPKPPAPAPAPALPKTVPVIQKAPPKTHIPVVNNTPAPNAITTPLVAAAPDPALTSMPSNLQAPAAPSQPKTISSGVEYIQAPQPEYPPSSRRMGEEGKTILRVLVNDRGRADRVEIQKSSGSPRLDDAARQAVIRALFKPYMEDGKAVSVYAIVPIKFQLD